MLRIFRGLLAVIISILVGCTSQPNALLEQSGAATPGETQHFHPKGKPPSKYTKAVLERARTALPFADKRDFEEQKKGFIAAPKSMKIMADAGHVAWDLERYQFLLEDQKIDSVHPSLLRMSQLNMNYGLYEVIPGEAQRRLSRKPASYMRRATIWKQ